MEPIQFLTKLTHQKDTNASICLSPLEKIINIFPEVTNSLYNQQGENIVLSKWKGGIQSQPPATFFFSKRCCPPPGAACGLAYRRRLGTVGVFLRGRPKTDFGRVLVVVFFKTHKKAPQKKIDTHTHTHLFFFAKAGFREKPKLAMSG